jgi:hypothetical protein
LVGVYTSKYPSEAPALMKYGDIVRDLASRGHNWGFYDENLMSGFKFGFSLHFEGLKQSFEANNLSSCIEHSDVVDKKITKELDAHRLAGPFSAPPFSNFRISDRLYLKRLLANFV